MYFESHTQTQFKFASLQERLVTNLVSEESLRSKKGVSRPTPFDSYCPSICEISLSGIFSHDKSFRILIENSSVVGSLNSIVNIFARLNTRTAKI